MQDVWATLSYKDNVEEEASFFLQLQQYRDTPKSLKQPTIHQEQLEYVHPLKAQMLRLNSELQKKAKPMTQQEHFHNNHTQYLLADLEKCYHSQHNRSIFLFCIIFFMIV